MLSDRLEKTLNRAFELATVNEHEYATLEHLLSALIDDEDANEVLLSCNVDVEELRAILNDFINNELQKIEGDGSALSPAVNKENKSSGIQDTGQGVNKESEITPSGVEIIQVEE